MPAYRLPFAQRHPLVLPVLALMVGMLGQDALPLSGWVGMVVLGMLGIAYGLWRRKTGWLGLLFLLSAFAGVGGILIETAHTHPSPALNTLLAQRGATILAGKAGLGEKLTGGKYALRLQVEAVAVNGQWQPVEAVVNLRVPSDPYPEPGTRLVVRGFYVPNDPVVGDPLWQGYRESLARQDVAGGMFATRARSGWQMIDPPSRWEVRVYAQRAAFRLNGLLDATLEGGEEAAVAKALLLGTRETLTEELRRSYTAAGAIHLLVVSGGHLALLWGILFWLLKRLPPHWQGTGRWVGRLLLLLCLWAFAFLTGLAPSIVRAAVMLTLVQTGIALGRPSSGINALAAACLLMLLWDPLTVHAVGFQLSVACVAGIMVLADPIEAWRKPKKRILEILWKAFAVTLAAQAGALPLTLLYFGQMPVWFWLANPPAVLLSELLLWAMLPLLALAALASSFTYLGWIVKPVAVLVKLMLSLLNGWMALISHLPFAVQEGWQIPVGQAVVLGFLLVWLATVPRGIGLRHAQYGVVLAGVWAFLGCWQWSQIAGIQRQAVGYGPGGFYLARQVGLRLQGPDLRSVRLLGYVWGTRDYQVESRTLSAQGVRTGSVLLVPSRSGMSRAMRRRVRTLGWQVVDLSRQSFYVLPNAETVQ